MLFSRIQSVFGVAFWLGAILLFFLCNKYLFVYVADTTWHRIVFNAILMLFDALLYYCFRRVVTAQIMENRTSTSQNGNRVFNICGVEFIMVYVEGGTYVMGSDDIGSAKPVHKVTLSDYYIGETEVTQKLWEVVMGSNPAKIKGKHCPVENVSWNDCQEFIGKLNELTGENFCLPTEAQWEFAARGGNYSKGYKYSGSNDIDAVAWCWRNSYEMIHPVGTKLANELGIYDMSGNVREWCSDWYGEYLSVALTDPTGPLSGSYRVNRGGGWNYDSANCRCAYRSSNTPTHTYNNLGLRLALK